MIEEKSRILGILLETHFKNDKKNTIWNPNFLKTPCNTLKLVNTKCVCSTISSRAEFWIVVCDLLDYLETSWSCDKAVTWEVV